MDHIDKFLATASERQYSPVIRAALAIGKRTINKYYNMTDHSEVYRIAMGMSFTPIYILLPSKSKFSVLHPHHKLEYFKKHGWDATWIKTARQIVRDEFDRSYAMTDANADENVMQIDTDKPVSYVFLYF